MEFTRVDDSGASRMSLRCGIDDILSFCGFGYDRKCRPATPRLASIVVTYRQVTDVLENTANILAVVVSLVVSIITGASLYWDVFGRLVDQNF